MTLQPKKFRINMRWREIKTNMNKFEADILRLMAHPQATAQQIMEMRNHYVALNARMREVEQKLVQEGYVR